MLKKICNKCGRKINVNEKCECNEASRRESYKIYNEKYRDRVAQTFYNSKAWRRVRTAVKERAGGVDEYVKETEGRLERGEIAHHIEEISERPELSLEMENIIYVSEATHNKIHAAYKQGGLRAAIMKTKLKEVMGGVKKVCMDAGKSAPPGI